MVHNHNALTCRNKTLATLWQPPGVFSSFVVSETSKSGHPWTGRLQRSVSSVMTMAPRGLLSTLNLEVLISKPSQKQMLGTDSPFSALAWQWPQGEDAQWADSCPSAPPPWVSDWPARPCQLLSGSASARAQLWTREQ